MSKFRNCAVLLWMAAVVAGCATKSRHHPVTSAAQPSRPAATVVVPPELAIAPPMELAATLIDPAGDQSPNWPTNWVNAWVPLESWGQFNGLDKPRQLNGGLAATYQFPTTNGALTLRMGSHTLRFRGQEFWLGFAPRLIKGLPYVHAIDARKTLQPLLGPAFQLPRTNRTIVIDAGHGGRDSGAKSGVNGEYEKTYALDWALRLERLLTEQGWTVIMTRTNDTFISLPDRVAAAERAKADLFLSLHFNSGPGNGDLSGLETFCLTPTGMPSSLDRGFTDDTREWHPNNAFDEQNFHLATAIHRSLLGATGAADRGVRRARFLGVLRGQNRAAVLIEGGYLTNPTEARKIATPAYRQTLAEGVAKALE